MGGPKIGGSTSVPNLAPVAAKTAAAATDELAKVMESVLPLPGVKDVFQVAADAANGRLATAVNVNPSDSALNSATGRIPESAWSNPAELVGRMTQNDPASSFGADSRCGPTNLLAGALLQGPGEAAKFLKSAAAHSGDRLSATDKKSLETIADKVKHHTATYDDLSKAQGLLLQASKVRQHLGDALKDDTFADVKPQIDQIMRNFPNISEADQAKMSKLMSDALGDTVKVKLVTDPRDPSKKEVDVYTPGGSDMGMRDGLDDGELREAAKHGGLGATAMTFNGSSSTAVSDVLSKLKPGESAVVRVKTKPTDSDPGHFVTVGKLKDGRSYIYNPDPAQGDATLIVGNPKLSRDFDAALANYDARATTDRDGVNPGATKITY